MFVSFDDFDKRHAPSARGDAIMRRSGARDR
jgi:hypothetical protein